MNKGMERLLKDLGMVSTEVDGKLVYFFDPSSLIVKDKDINIKEKRDEIKRNNERKLEFARCEELVSVLDEYFEVLNFDVVMPIDGKYDLMVLGKRIDITDVIVNTERERIEYGFKLMPKINKLIKDQTPKKKSGGCGGNCKCHEKKENVSEFKVDHIECLWVGNKIEYVGAGGRQFVLKTRSEVTKPTVVLIKKSGDNESIVVLKELPHVEIEILSISEKVPKTGYDLKLLWEKDSDDK
jgi:hypothetical protein